MPRYGAGEIICLRIRLRLRRAVLWGCVGEIAAYASAHAVRAIPSAPAPAGRLGPVRSSIVVRRCRRTDRLGGAAQSATMGGCVDMVDTTMTRTPRRCTASTSERKSPSPENSTIWSTCGAISMASTASSISMLPLTLRRPRLIDEFLRRLGHDRIAIVVEPIDQRPDRRIFLILDHGCVVKRAHQIATRLKLPQQPLVVDVETEGLCGCV